jgi:hypothetical protein
LQRHGAAPGQRALAHPRPTFASILAAANVPPRRAMYLLGHTDAKLTLSVYQQVLDMSAGSIEVLEGVLGCSLQDAYDVLTSRVLVASSYPEPGARDHRTRGMLP